MSWPLAIVLARILADRGFEAPVVEQNEVLLIKRHDVAVGCTPGDAGTMTDAATDSGVDSSVDGAGDAGLLSDAGIADAGITDAGITDAGTGCTMIPGDAITMVVQPRFEADAMPTRFALLYVTPSRPVVEVTYDVFSNLRDLTAARHVVEEIEVPDPTLGRTCRKAEGCGGDDEYGGGCAPAYEPTWSPPSYDGSDTTDGGIVVEMVGAYEILRVAPTDRDQLTQWLDQVGFDYDVADVDALTPYIMRGYHVVAVRVAPTMPTATLQPLAITWAGSELRIPAALSSASQELTAYISAEGTYAFAGAKVPFSDSLTGAYVTRNELVLTPSTSPDTDPIARRQPDLHYRETITDRVEVPVPVEVDCNEPEMEDRGCCSDCNTHRRVRLDMIVLALAVMFVIRRRRSPHARHLRSTR